MVKEKLQEEIIFIDGLHCKSCVDNIESKISSLEGIENIKVSLAENKAFVVFDSEKINLEKIKSEIISLGYCVCAKKPCVCQKPGKGNRNIMQGIAYGLIPHIGCIAFIIGSILGVTILMQFFRPILMDRYIFHYLILISVGFATLSSVLYLRKNKCLSWDGIKRKKGYLSVMYGSTIGINLILFFFIFPLLANVSLTGAVIYDGNPENLETISLSVSISCPGHAPLISNELKTIEGVIDTKFSFPNNFDVKYDNTKTNLQEILSLEVFEEYTAKVLETSQNDNINVQQGGTCAGGCGGSASCGGSCGSPTCSLGR